MSSEDFVPMFNDQCQVDKSSVTISSYDIHLDEEIKDPTYYREAFQVLRNAQQGELIRIFISSVGGNLNSAIIFKNCIEACQGDVLAIIEGEAYSAASLIALSAHGIEVKPYSSMMCHSAAFGSGGIVQNVRDHVDFVGKHAESVMYEVYQDFLNPEELEDLRRGREIWLDHIQIGERLDVMFEARKNKPCNCGDPNCGVDSEEDEEPEITLEDIISNAVEKGIQEGLGKILKKYDLKEKPKKTSAKVKPDSVTMVGDVAVSGSIK